MNAALRRIGPRIGIDAMCWEMSDKGESTCLGIDLSAHGICIERPYLGGPVRRSVPLEVEVPGIDEVMWVKGEATYDVLVRTTPSGMSNPLGLIRRTGYRIAGAATRDLRMLKEFVFETYRMSKPDLRLDYAPSM